MQQQYLGDGVYASIDVNATNVVTLTTGHHDPAHADNVIYMEPSMVNMLSELLRREREIERTPRL